MSHLQHGRCRAALPVRPRRRLAQAALLAVLTTVFSAELAPTSATAAERPNVVVIMTDDQDASSMRVMRGVERQLAGKGTTFSNAFATFPLCCPSRATFLTGQYGHNHGVMSNHPPEGGYSAFDDSGTLPVAMRRAGYRTGYVGKYLNGYQAQARQDPSTIPPGWSYWHALVGGRMYKYGMNDNGRLRHYGRRARNYQTDVLARYSRHFIRQASRGRRPFFLSLMTFAPHTETGRRLAPNPRSAPRHRGAFSRARLPRSPSFDEADVSDKPQSVRSRPRLDDDARQAILDQYRARLASLLAVDDAVKGIVAALRRSGELRNTLIVFTSDNGFLLGEHRLRGKVELYEEAARVPLVMRGPGVPRGVTRPQVVGNIDLAPTIMDVAGATPRRLPDGVSLLPMARNATRGRDRSLLLENRRSAAVRSSRHMYAEHASGEQELYELLADPFQLESIHEADDPGTEAVRARLAARLETLQECAGAGCR